MQYIITLVFILFTTFVSSQEFQKYVNPMIGTGGHGHTFPGATVPFGMVQLSPDTRIDGSWDGCSGYHFSDSIIYGFSHTHLNGTGVSDFGDIMIMPTMGKPTLNKTDYSSKFSHNNEKATAGYYKVKLDKYDIDAELTSSTRVGLHQYTFRKSGEANIILDLNHRDKLLQGEIKIINDRTIEILRRSNSWANDQYVYARIEFKKAMKITKFIANEEIKDNLYSGTQLAICFSKKVKKGEKIMMKVSLSPTSYDGALKNMSEIQTWDFNKVVQNAKKLWNKELSKIAISSNDQTKLTIFYTALYHTMIQPNIAQDVDGKYRGRDNKIHLAQGFNYYSVFSLWDTFRGAHPLYTIIDHKRTSDYINTFIAQFKQGGRLPVWELASNETDCMIGYHSVSVIADAMAKGITGFDYEKAFTASKYSAMLDHLGLASYKKNGVISIDDEHESVSKTLEYAYDDWCIAQMAQLLNKKEDYSYFMERSQNWKNVFDSKTGFMRPRKNGGWYTPFDAREVNNNYTEGNSWQYSFFVPQDIDGLINALGGKVNFEAKLDEMFSSPSTTTGRAQVDITGLIGQYAHGNEPSHHMAYLYNYVNKPEKTKATIHSILNTFYANAPDGLIGNEDCGQMSAWYVLSSLGIYSVSPGKPIWSTTEPFFDKAVVTLENGKVETITSSTSKSVLEIFGINKPTTQPESFNEITAIPAIEADSKSFKENLGVGIETNNSKDSIFYLIQNNRSYMKDMGFMLYTKPFTLNETSTVIAYASRNGVKSKTTSASYVKKPNDWTIALKSTYNNQYTAGGFDGIIDGIYGSENWKKGEWQGYQYQDFECVIDLKKEVSISEIASNYLQDSRSWILMPRKVEYYISSDNVNFTLVKTVENTIDPKETDTKIVSYKSSFAPVKAKYVKIKAYNFGKLPEWHQGFGDSSFLFIDEIEIK